MKAFNNSPYFKEAFLDQLRWHREHDRFIKGSYGDYTEDGEVFQACAIGCSMHSLARMLNIVVDTSDHDKLAELLGIPVILTHMEDRIFESLPIQYAIEWPYKFTEAIPVGADLSMVGPKWIRWRLSQELSSLADPDRVEERKHMIRLYDRVLSGKEVSDLAWMDARVDCTDHIASYAAFSAYEPDRVSGLISSQWSHAEFFNAQVLKLIELIGHAPVITPEPTTVEPTPVLAI